MKISKISFTSNKNQLPVIDKKSAVTNVQNSNKPSMKYPIAIATTAALGGLLYYGITHKKPPQAVNSTSRTITHTISEYSKELAKDLSAVLKRKIAPENLSSVLSKEEFLKEVSSLKAQNYVASKENIANGIFRADLHSHSLYSDGKASVKNILNGVCDYADKLFKKTGKKFLYALTDHDTTAGVKEALQIIATEPEKFKNVQFVTGAEVSYLIPSTKTANPFETSELLIYGFNPFNKKVDTFFKNLKDKRLNVRKNYIKDLSEKFTDTKFSLDEFQNVFLPPKSRHPKLNDFWEVYHYGQIKKILSDTAKAKGEDSEKFFAEIMSKSPERLNVYEFKKAGLIENWINENPQIKLINDKYRPHIDKSGKIIQNGENTIEDIAKAFGNDEACVIGLAHPYYISERNDDAFSVIKNVIAKVGKNMQLTESYHQAYSPNLLAQNGKTVSFINNFCESQKLIPIGGRDNHQEQWLGYK